MIDPAQIAEAERAFSALIGMPLSYMHRVLGQRFCFGEAKERLNRRGQIVWAHDWRIVANCHWRIEGPNGFLLSYKHFEPVRTDQFAYPFYESLDEEPPVVESVSVSKTGAVTLRMSRGYVLVLGRTPGRRTWEDWRFMPSEGHPSGHLVLEEGKIEWSGKAPGARR